MFYVTGVRALPGNQLPSFLILVLHVEPHVGPVVGVHPVAATLGIPAHRVQPQLHTTQLVDGGLEFVVACKLVFQKMLK